VAGALVTDALLTGVDALLPEVLRLGDVLRARGWRLASAESCTGGLIAALCTSVAGSSDWFEAGYVTYSNGAKRTQLGVPADLLLRHGAVSEPVARAMAEGACRQAGTPLAVAVTGIAGPSGGTPDKPVGTVWVAWARRSDGTACDVGAHCLHLAGDRTAVRSQTVAWVLGQLLALATGA
jgi:nicotinamide-nucleotide amidase